MTKWLMIYRKPVTALTIYNKFNKYNISSILNVLREKNTEISLLSAPQGG